MKIYHVSGVGLLLLTLLIYSPESSALAECAATDTCFTINDINPPLKSTSGTSLDISNGGAEYDIGGGKKIKIVPVSTSSTPNFPEVYYDENLDLLGMRNAKITTSTPPVDSVKFKFWRKLNSIQGGADVNYSISAAGALMHFTSGTPYDSIQSRGWVDGTILLGNLNYPPPTPADCLYVLSKCTGTGANSSVVFSSANYSISQSLNLTPATNELRGEFWIHLSDLKDFAQLSQLYGMKVKYGPPGDITPCPECPVCPQQCPASPVWWFIFIIVLLFIIIFLTRQKTP